MATCNRGEEGEIRVLEMCNRGEEDEIRVPKVTYKKGAWSKEEDEKLIRAVEEQGIRNWVTIEKTSGLGRPAKNCRLRWLNYLRPNLKKYPFTQEEEKLIVDLHAKFGNSWARIANKLPGRSDNEIKNFWHKRAKKCKREKLPIYPSQQKQSHTYYSSTDDEANTTNLNHKDDYYPPNHTPSQFQPPTPIIVNNASDAPSIHSPLSMISTPQPQFLSSPTTTLLNTPTSQTHNSFLSSPSTIPDHPPSSIQGGAFRKPPPLLSSSPLTRFLRVMESPTSPLKLNLSPGLPPSQTTDSPPAAAAPLSPLKLRLSFPETCSQSIPDEEKVELNSSAQAMTLDTDRDDVPRHETPSIQFSPPQVEEKDSNLEIMEELRKAQARVRFLKNKLKKKKSSRNHHQEITDLSRGEAPPDESSSQSTIKDCALSCTSSRLEDVVAASNVPPKTPRKKDGRKGGAIGISKPQGLQVKKARKRKTPSESSGSKEKSLPKEEDLKRINSENLQEQTPSIDFCDHLNVPSSQGCADKCSSSMEGFLSESSALLQDGFFKGDFYGQTSLIENPYSSQRHAPLVDTTFAQYSQSSATTPGDEGGQLISYLQPDDLGFSFMDGCGSDLLMHQNTTSADLLDFDFLRCEHFSLQNSVGCSSESQPSCMFNSSYQTCKQLMEQEPSETAKIHESGFVQHQIPETSVFDSRYMMSFEHEMEGLLVDNLWPQGQMEVHDQTFSVNRVDSVINPMESMMDWNNGSTTSYTGGHL